MDIGHDEKQPSPPALCNLRLSVQDMTCAACVSTVEGVLQKVLLFHPYGMSFLLSMCVVASDGRSEQRHRVIAGRDRSRDIRPEHCLGRGFGKCRYISGYEGA